MMPKCSSINSFMDFCFYFVWPIFSQLLLQSKPKQLYTKVSLTKFNVDCSLEMCKGL